jgi:hypothetical protein
MEEGRMAERYPLDKFEGLRQLGRTCGRWNKHNWRRIS